MIVILFVLSAAMLAYEILLTRMASVLLTNPYTFMVLAMALLGISAGAILEYGVARRQATPPAMAPGLWLGSSSIVLTLTTVWLVKGNEIGGVLGLSLAAALPFMVSGAILARLFRIYPERTGSLYAADLAGAAAGALVVPVLLPAVGPVQSIGLLAALLGLTGIVTAWRRNGRRQALFSMLVTSGVTVLLVLNYLGTGLGAIPVGKDPNKDLAWLLSVREGAAEIVESHWSTFGRTDLVRLQDDPDTMALFIDGAAGTDMLRLNGNTNDNTSTFLQAMRQFGGMAPLLSLGEQQKDHALIIGPGGGRDVLMALTVGFKQITAVEINPQIVDIVKAYREYNGGIYTDYEQVKVVVAEGRRYLRHSDEKYDLIMLLMPVTKSSRSLNAFALSENYLFTQEAFRDYHRHLTDEGSLIIMAHNMIEIAKLLTTALDALQDEGLGVKEAMTHLYVLGSSMMPLMGLRKTPLSPQELTFLHSAAHDSVFDSLLSYIPGVTQHGPRPPLSVGNVAQVPMMSPLFLALADGKLPLRVLKRETGFNFVPARDNRPFFFQFTFGTPAVVLAVLGLALIALAAVCWLPTVLRRAHLQAPGERFSRWLFVYFTAIGFGYITIELALLQKLDFFLGDPARSLSLLLAALLIGSGVGSWLSRNAPRRKAVSAGILSAAGGIFLLAVLPAIFQALHDTALAVQQGIAAVLLFLQGVPMGYLFPLGLRVAQARWGPSVIPWMWAVNGCASVAGSALAISIAMSFGYTWVHLFGGACYVMAGIAMLRIPQRERYGREGDPANIEFVP